MKLKYVKPDSIITGWDFSTSGVKCLAFDLEGNVVDRIRLPMVATCMGTPAGFRGDERGTARGTEDRRSGSGSHRPAESVRCST